MIYRIETNIGKNPVVFDIEYYLTDCEKDGKKLWYSELHCLPITEGIIQIARSIKDDAIAADFTNDCHIIAELRGELYEGGELWCGLSYNNPAELKEASHRHYHVIEPELRKRLDKFCEKWNCSCITD